MNLRQATAAIIAAGINAKLVLAADPEMEDDEIILNGNDSVGVQVSATRNGLRFSASVQKGTGADWTLTHGKMTADPVAAAREALTIHQRGMN